MAKTRGDIIKRYGPNASKNKKRKAEEVSKASKKKKIIVEEHETNSDSDTMAEIDNYHDSSARSSDDVESSNDKSDSEDESSRDTQTGDEDEDPRSLSICAKDISGKSYDLKTWIDEIGSFPAKKIVRARMDVYCDLINLLNKINLKKQSEVVNERGNALYALYGFLWAFLVWIYEVFPHLGKYVKKSLDSPLPISHLLRWHTTKNIILTKAIHLSTKEKVQKYKVYLSLFSNIYYLVNVMSLQQIRLLGINNFVIYKSYFVTKNLGRRKIICQSVVTKYVSLKVYKYDLVLRR
ncbi:hypothetical protein H5410_031546 [Solanum commersonii]|uniref:Uncharacterized protein n=1 Tax=Solanum commersonii TaxID=4109 RepID=A0A9J5YKH3_SOLCO|nr:hypothetical protein H5410_031546 [Solanum commersonii]